AFIMIFTIGGFTGMMLAMAPADYQYHDTYFVVSHFHYTMGISAIYAIVGAIYFWLPKWSGRLYDERLAKIQFWISIVAVNVTFFPQFFLGLAGMPRRIPDYSLQFADFNMLSSLGAWVFGSAQLLFLFIVLKTVFAGQRTAEARIWDGATGLEWTLPSPAPYHSFATPPVVH
ncbi:MAG: cbb3-type cytochrome c oxidase subunit I, partial [Acidobacteria bacterium]|nr:cbb3-type cytochrome c oxidase subunit I [Acidobacteriota bacterium]